MITSLPVVDRHTAKYMLTQFFERWCILSYSNSKLVRFDVT